MRSFMIAPPASLRLSPPAGCRRGPRRAASPQPDRVRRGASRLSSTRRRRRPDQLPPGVRRDRVHPGRLGRGGADLRFAGRARGSAWSRAQGRDRTTTTPSRRRRRRRATPELFEDDVALMCYTSGTTGRPKGALLTHGNLVASTLSWIHEMRAGQDDVWLSGQPLFHIGGINGLLPFLVLGATVIITPSTTFDPEAMLRLIEVHGVTMCIFVPDAVGGDLPQPCRGARRSRQLRVAMWGASPAPLQHARGDGQGVSARGDRQRLRPDRDVRSHDAAGGPRLDPQDGLGRQADARGRVAGRRRRARATCRSARSERSSTAVRT